jgi:PTH1 family peptidyl-tRNA hydrolase
MYVIAGLGNPGKKYEHTRHNMGFDTVDILSERYDIPLRRHLFKGLYGKGVIEGEKVILLKPQTYMNASGDCIQPLCRHYKVKTDSDLIVISDDISMEAGRLRTRKSGSAGGHNGLKSIIERLGNDNFIRIKIGVGNRDRGDLVEHVLGRPKGEDLDKIRSMQERAADTAVAIITDGVDAAINKYNC